VKTFLILWLAAAAFAAVGCVPESSKSTSTTEPSNTHERTKNTGKETGQSNDPKPTRNDPVTQGRGQAPAPAVDAETLQRMMREEIRPVLETMAAFMLRTGELEAKFAQFESGSALHRKETSTAMAGYRRELDTFRGELANVRRALQQRDAGTPAWEAVLASLEKTNARIDALTTRIEAIEKAKISRVPTDQGTTTSFSWNTKNVRLPCGMQLNNLNVPPAGGYVQCPRCGKVYFVK
jgi:hypothetical protein